MSTKLLVILALGIAAAAARAEERGWPEGVEGFSGQVRGVVVEAGEKLVVFRVGRVLKVWEGSTAAHPEALAGQTIRIGPRWVQGEAGWHAVENHVAFLRRLAKGEEITLEVKTSEAGRFALLELSKEQRQRARGEEAVETPAPRRESALPEGVAGFVGRVRGVVLEKLDDSVVRFRIEKVTRVWRGNEATNIEAMENLTVRVGPAFRQGEDGKWRQLEAHVRFVQCVAKGEKLDLEIRHGERDYFPILELTRKQRERTPAEAAGLDVLRYRQARAQIEEFEKALAMFKMETGRFPDQLDELTAAGGGFEEGLLSRIPPDPWGNHYVYDPAGGTKRRYLLISMGADGVEGTEDDLTNEHLPPALRER